MNYSRRSLVVFCLSAALTLAAPPCSVAAAGGSANSAITLFAFDDYGIPWRSNLKLTMTPPKKHPDNPLLPRGGKDSVDELGVQFYGSVIEHEGKYKLWYIALDNTALKISRMGLSGMRPAYAESDDGVHWSKPNLGLVEHNGDADNNLVAMDPPGACGIHLIVIHEPDDPDPKARFKMMMTSLTHLKAKKRNVSTSVAFVSADGLTWRSLSPLRYKNGYINDEDRVLPPVHFEQGGLFRWKGMYHLAGQQISPWIHQPDGKVVGRVMSTFRSPDLATWQTAPAFGFMRGTAVGIPGKPSEDEEAHLASSVWHRNNVLLGVYGIWRGGKEWKDRRMDLGLNISNDGVHFREPIRDYVLIERGQIGEWDVGGLLQGQGFAHVGDQTRIYYGAWDLTVAPKFPPRGGVGMVTLRRDGFGYLSRLDQTAAAEFDTVTIAPKAGAIRLFANVDQVGGKAHPTVELIDERGRPIAGYSGEHAARLGQSGVHKEILWPAAGNAEIKLDQPFSIRVRLPKNSGARIYALYAEEK